MRSDTAVAIEFAIKGVIIGALFGVPVGDCTGRLSAKDHACGECDHVGECGDYECRPGVDGWQLKAGAR